MPEIYEIDVEGDIDVISESNLSHIIREIWFIFDSSVIVELSKLFIDKNSLNDKNSEDLFQLIKFLSTHNINIHPITLFESGRNKKALNKLNKSRTIEQIKALYISQCLNKQQELDVHNWMIDEERVEKLLSRMPYEGSNLQELSESSYVKLFESSESKLSETLNEFNGKIYEPYLNALRAANMKRVSKLKKVTSFFASIEGFKYFPKLVDYCLRLLYIENDSMLKGGLRKIKTELFNTALDFYICDLAILANFNEPFEDIKPKVHFYTFDKNMSYYFNLKGTLILDLENGLQRIHYPDLSYIKEKEILNIAKNYFKLTPVQDFKKTMIDYFIHKMSISSLKSIEKIDFCELAPYKNFYLVNK